MDTITNITATLVAFGAIAMVIQIVTRGKEWTALKRRQQKVVALSAALIALSTPFKHAGRTNGWADALGVLLELAAGALIIYSLVLWGQVPENNTPKGGA